jgi:hypothetical protein
MDNFESIEIRRVRNGFIVVITTADDVMEYVYPSSRAAIKVIKQLLENKNVT